jgi:DNA primase
MDVITAHQHGFHNVVASMGTSITEKQVNTLKRLTKNITLALDADAAGEEATLRAVGYENTLDAEVKVIILPKGKDPDEVIKEDPQTWQHLHEDVVPVIDYTFDMVTSELDLNKVGDKTLARNKLLPIIAEIKDVVRRAHYLQKLARLIRVNERNLEADLSRFKPAPTRYQAREPKLETAARSLRPLLSSPIEEECLAWLLQYPELNTNSASLLPEYFENSENREIFLALRKGNDVKLIRDNLDSAIHEHLDSLLAKSLPPTNGTLRENVIGDIILRLKEKFLRSQAAIRAERLALEVEPSAGSSDKLQEEEQAVEESRQLREVFTQRHRRK